MLKGEDLRAMRKSKGYTLASLSKIAGLSKSRISMLELHPTPPKVATAKKIAGALGFDWKQFFEDDPPPSPSEGA